MKMKPPFTKLLLLTFAAFITTSLSAPIEDKKTTGCNTAKGAVRSSVESTDTIKSVHLLADLDALANGIKRSDIEKGCDNEADKKSKTDVAKEGAASNVPGTKKQTLNVIKEGPIVNEDDIDKVPIVETGKAAIRSSIIKNETQNQTESSNATVSKTNATEGSTSINAEGAKNNSTIDARQAENSTTLVQGTAAKTFISSKAVDVNGDKRSGTVLHKGKAKLIKNKSASKKSNAVSGMHKTVQISKDDGPSMQKGSLLKETEKQEKAASKSTANILSPLTSAIKSLDSASKLLGMATASKNTAATAATGDTKTTTDQSVVSKSTADQIAALKPSSQSNATSPDVSSSTRSAPSSSSSAKASSGKPAPAPSASKPVDPYAEIATGPDSPKMPDLKTGSDKAGLPVMKVDSTGAGPEPVSFAKDEPGAEPPKPAAAGSSSRPGPQDVGGILDRLTDRLNKDGVAPENPLPPTESKTITDQLTQYDHDALETAKGWESTGLRAIEKLKSDEFSRGSMKNELSKELTDRLAGGGGGGGGGGGYGAAIGPNIEGPDPSTEVSNLDAPSQTSYSPPGYGRQQQSSQWQPEPSFNSIESLDSEAQREEQSFSQYGDGHEGNYGESNEALMSSEQNGYDRQDIPAFLNQGLVRDAPDSSDQGQYYKRNIILKPYYYYYDHNLPYGFKHPYDD